jgi:hypothetical protein
VNRCLAVAVAVAVAVVVDDGVNCSETNSSVLRRCTYRDRGIIWYYESEVDRWEGGLEPGGYQLSYSNAFVVEMGERYSGLLLMYFGVCLTITA